MTLYELEHERYMQKKPTGRDFYPLSQDKDIQYEVFENKMKKINAARERRIK